MDNLKTVKIYTDGACTGNPGRGGYGVILQYGMKSKQMSGGFRLTTNNRMELMAAIVGLKELRYKCSVTIYSDSQYVVQGISKGWAKKWRDNNWQRDKKHKAVNVDLWEELLDLCAGHEVTFCWVKGHVGHEENECCDGLATKAAQSDTLALDIVYENTLSDQKSEDADELQLL